MEEDADLLGDSLDNKKDTKDKKSNSKSKMKVMKLGK